MLILGGIDAGVVITTQACRLGFLVCNADPLPETRSPCDLCTFASGLPLLRKIGASSRGMHLSS